MRPSNPIQLLPDGSFLSVIRPTGVGRTEATEQALTVRVIEYVMPGVDDWQPRYRLLHQGATRCRVPHAELSFKGRVELLRRSQPHSGAFPPRATPKAPTLVQ